MLQPIDYTHYTLGAFIQNIWKLSEQFSIENGFRIDKQDPYGTFLLPRSSLFYEAGVDLSFRLSAGLGYKTPTLFTEDAERLQFQNLIAIDDDKLKAEESFGLNFDINYRTAFMNEITFSMNHLLFYTRIDNPIQLTLTINNLNEFQQSSGFIESKGLESNFKITYDHFKLFIGYTYADVEEDSLGKKNQVSLVSEHRLNNVLMYEKHDDLRIGLEAYYFSPQLLSDESKTEAYWIFGLMTEKNLGQFSIFLNFENFLDTRQTKFEQIYTGTISQPVFKEIYAPVDGFVINGGIKIRF